MKKVKIETEIEEYLSIDDLKSDDRELLRKAQAVGANAYAPYSEFKVGAALKLENGEVVLGSNQENASFPHGMCAERVALFAAGAAHPDIAVKTIAIVSSSKNKDYMEPAMPCGGCRQSIVEYEMRHRQPVRLILKGDGDKVVIVPEAGHLLPLHFNFPPKA